jgi:hypothetical protein
MNSIVRVGVLNGIAYAFASRADGTNANVPASDLDYTSRILEERRKPSIGLSRPGTCIDATPHHTAMHHLVLPVGRNLIRQRRPGVPEDRPELAAETLLIKLERCLALS